MMFDLWRKGRERESKAKAIAAFSTDDGWMEWTWCAPSFRDCPVQITGIGWENPRVVSVEEMHPHTNVAGLYWRRTGIYRDREERELANAVAQRLMGRKSSADATSGYTANQQTAMQGQNLYGQQANSSFHNNLLGIGSSWI